MATLAIVVVSVTAAAIVAYLISLRLRPWWRCRACGGSGKTRSRLRPGASGTCGKCLGGRVPRLGIRVLNPDRARQMRPVKGVHRKTDRR